MTLKSFEIAFIEIPWQYKRTARVLCVCGFPRGVVFDVDVPVFDEMGVLTSWTMFHGILGVEASRFSMRIQVLGR